jgi:hypothetical protein
VRVCVRRQPARRNDLRATQKSAAATRARPRPQLDLRGNGMGNDGAILLSRGVRVAESKVLGELDLGYNEIKDDGACALAQVRACVCMCVYMCVYVCVWCWRADACSVHTHSPRGCEPLALAVSCSAA